jgi:hypothetical protein
VAVTVSTFGFAAFTFCFASVEAASNASALVTTPIALVDVNGAVPDDSTIAQVSKALAQATSTRAGARMAAGEGALATPAAATMPADLAALAAKAAKAAEELDTKNGIRLHRDLIDKVSARLADVGDVGPLADARLSLASLYLATNEQLLAKTELDAAARLRPNAELDLSRWPPNVAEAFSAAQGRVRSEPGANLDVGVEPAGAVVFVDGVRVGESPQSLSVRRGPHVIWAGAPGHAPLIRAVDAAAGSRARIDGSLTAEPSWELGQRLSEAAVAGGTAAKRADAVAVARALGREEHAATVIVTGVVDVAGGVAVLLARADDEPRIAVVALDAGLSGASTAIGQGLAALDQPAGAFSGGVLRVRGDHAPDPASLKLDASKWLLGVASTTRGAPALAARRW